MNLASTQLITVEFAGNFQWREGPDFLNPHMINSSWSEAKFEYFLTILGNQTKFILPKFSMHFLAAAFIYII